MLFASVAAAAPDLPSEPVLNPASASAAPAGTWLVGGGLAGGWTDGPRGGFVGNARWWPVRHMAVAMDVQGGVADLGCVSCSGTQSRLSVRGNVLERDVLRVGLYGAGTGTVGLGFTGSLSAGVVAEGGTEQLRIDVAAPVASTVDLLEDARTGWETGLSWYSTPSHVTRVGTVGPLFRPTLSHRYLRDRSWLSGELVWMSEGPVLRLRAGRVF
jgi:hypothetical protein